MTNEEYKSLRDAGMVNDIYINLGQEDTAFSGERTFESIQKMLRTPYKTSGVFNTEGDEESSCVYQDSGSYSGMTKAELYSVQLYDIMQSFSVPREAHRMIVRLMNSTIAGYETMMAGLLIQYFMARWLSSVFNCFIFFREARKSYHAFGGSSTVAFEKIGIQSAIIQCLFKRMLPLQSQG